MSEKSILRSRPQPSSSERSEMTNVQIRVKGFVPIWRLGVSVVDITWGASTTNENLDRFLKKWSIFRKNALFDITATTKTLGRRIGSYPLTRICTLVISERSEELGWGRERKSGFSDMWHMLKKLENAVFCYTPVMSHMKVSKFGFQNGQKVPKINFSDSVWKIERLLCP